MKTNDGKNSVVYKIREICTGQFITLPGPVRRASFLQGGGGPE